MPLCAGCSESAAHLYPGSQLAPLRLQHRHRPLERMKAQLDEAESRADEPAESMRIVVQYEK